jgi:hypothetical protein
MEESSVLKTIAGSVRKAVAGATHSLENEKAPKSGKSTFWKAESGRF